MVVFNGGVAATSISPGVVSGWQDWNDAATASAPISLSAIPSVMTNDGLGSFTNLAYSVTGHGNIWDVSTNLFDFTDLKVGDTVDFRTDFLVTTVSPNTVITTGIELGIGGSPYTLNFDSRSFKGAGSYQITRWSSVYMGDTNTLNNGARFVMSSDSVGDTVVVNGWYIRTMVR